jgi:hypothetical protein
MFPSTHIYDPGDVGYACECKAPEVCEGLRNLSDLQKGLGGRSGCKSTKGDILVNTTEQWLSQLGWVNTGTVTRDAPKLALRNNNV